MGEKAWITLLCKRLCYIESLCPRSDPVYSVVALSAVSGQVLWRKVTRESVMYIQCGLQHSTQKPAVVLISKSLILAVNGTTGEKATLRISNYLLVTTVLPVLTLSFVLKVMFTKSQVLLFKTGSNGSPFTLPRENTVVAPA